jgi:Ribonuclease G/E
LLVFFKTISVCHTFEIIERCILTADSQGLILLTWGNAVSTSCIARNVAECKKKWQDVQGTTKKTEAARRAIARASGGGSPPVSNIRPWESAVSIQRSIISNVWQTDIVLCFVS